MTGARTQAFLFGRFRLEPSEQRLTKDGAPVALPPKVLRTLIVLVEEAGSLVTKETLMQRIWPDSFVAEVTLTHNIHVLRKTLGQAPGGGSWIETVAKTGYRFLGVEGVEPAALTPTPPGRARETALPPSGAEKSGASRLGLAAAAALLLLAGVAALVLARRSEARRALPVRSIAVLPFRAIGTPASESYVELGLAESVIARLSRIQGLTVRPLRSVERYRGADARQAARELGVEAAIDGTLQRDGANVRVTAYLVRASDGALIWSDTVTDVSSNLLAAEENLSAQLLNALRPAVVATSRAPARVDPAAYELYLRGRYLWNRRTPDAMAKAADSFAQAIERDRGFAAAWASLADTHAMLAGLASGDPRRHISEARAAAAEALRLDEAYGPAHSALGLIAENYEYDWARAESEYRRAMELSPGDPTAAHRLGEMLGLLGRFDEGLALLARAAAVDPLSPIIHADTAKVLAFAERSEASLHEADRVLELDPAFTPAIIWRATALNELGRKEEAFEETLRYLSLDGSFTAKTAAGVTYVLHGDRAGTQRILDEALAADARGESVVPLYVAQLYMHLGHPDEALDWLERAYREGNILLGIGVNSTWKPLHAHPRFQSLCKKLGLPIVEVAPPKNHRIATDSQGL